MPKRKFNIATALANLCEYAEQRLTASKYDIIYAHNQLLDFFKLAEPGTGQRVAGFANGYYRPYC